MSHLVIGAGEVGRALAEVLGADLRDLAPHTGTYDTIHIAFPWSDTFADIVDWYALEYDAAAVVVHSTVPAGTCDPHGWTHSPVRGRHPHLIDGIRSFTKHFGGPDAAAAAKAFADVGVDTVCHELAATTELGKLLELAAYGATVRIEKEAHALCSVYGVPYDQAYTTFSHTYNRGYAMLGEDRFIKPVLDHIPGPIGGHCVAQNTPLLGSVFFDNLVGPISPDGWSGRLD